MKKSKVVDSFYRAYEKLEHISICTGQDNTVIEIENISEDVYAHISSETGPYMVIAPGSRASFGSLKLTKDQLKIVYKTQQPLNYEDDWEYYND